MVRRCGWRAGLVCLALLGAAGPAWAGLDSELEAAAQALRSWDQPAADAAAERLMAMAPSDPAVLLAAGHAALLGGRYAEAVEQLQQAVHLGAGEGAAHLLELAKATEEETRDYEEHLTASGHFLIRHAPGIDAVMVPYAEQVLESAWTELTPIFGHQPAPPVRVEIYPRVEVLGAVSSLTVDEIKTSGTIALCKYNRLMITSPRDLVYGYGWADTLAHEFIHLLVTQKSRNTVPIWIHEGLAKYFEGYWRRGHVPALDRRSEDLLARALGDGSLISFEAMSPSMAKLPSQEATATAFAEVFTVIQYLERQAGPAVAARLVSAMGEGRSDRDAVAEVAGIPWGRFEPAWKGFLKEAGLRRMDDVFDQRLLFKGQDTEASELDAIKGEAARKFVWLGDRMRLSERWKAAAKEYAKASAEVGPDTPIVQSKLGFALLQLGRVDEAIAALEPPLSLYPSYMLLRVYLGDAYLRRGDYERAREHLEAAILNNPFDPEVHGHLAKALSALGREAEAQRERQAQELVNRR
ncbi:MAG: tetratricopeptide repeat protein [Deltaproteobacteria bacterium]|nr:tetratricopeptide repeat protein [Deltaproteobacteria bacterium]